ncbi:MAG: nucleotidyl transferase AbiEii/AbiGii toxin family protein, partial [Planctomycetales bacterium]
MGRRPSPKQQGYVEDLRKIRRRALIAMFSDDSLMSRLVLKGGNALDLIYSLSYRTSLDLDFSIESTLEPIDDLRERVGRALEVTFQEVGIVAFDVDCREVPGNITPELAGFWGGYQVEFKMPFDVEGYRVYVYSPDMLVAEKIRAICQQMPVYVHAVGLNARARPRDFVDLHALIGKFSTSFGGIRLGSVLDLHADSSYEL